MTQHDIGTIASGARREAEKAGLLVLASALLEEAQRVERERADRLHDALSQAVGWIEECGSNHDGRQFVLTESRAALKGLKLARADGECASNKDGTL